MNARAGALADDQIDAEILHRRIEYFLDRGLQAMNFVEEENFFTLKRSKDRGEISFAFEQGAGAGFDGNVQLVGNDLGQRGLAQTGRAIEQDMIQCLAAAARGLYGDLNI